MAPSLPGHRHSVVHRLPTGVILISYLPWGSAAATSIGKFKKKYVKDVYCWRNILFDKIYYISSMWWSLKKLIVSSFFVPVLGFFQSALCGTKHYLKQSHYFAENFVSWHSNPNLEYLGIHILIISISVFQAWQIIEVHFHSIQFQYQRGEVLFTCPFWQVYLSHDLMSCHKKPFSQHHVNRTTSFMF